MNPSSSILYPTEIESLRQQLASALLWKEAVEHELIVAGIWKKSHDNDPKKAVKEAIDWYVQVPRQQIEWVRGVTAAHGYDGPLGSGCCPLAEWLDERESLRKQLATKQAKRTEITLAEYDTSRGKWVLVKEYDQLRQQFAKCHKLLDESKPF